MATQNLTIRLKPDGEPLIIELPFTADGEIRADIAVAAGATIDIAVAFKKAKLAILAMRASQVLTITFNNGGTPDVFATKGFLWYTGSAIANPFTTDVVSMVAHNATAVDTTLSIRGLQDVSDAE